MSSRVVIGRKYRNISKVLNNNNRSTTDSFSQTSIEKILKENNRKDTISNNDKFDQIKKEILLNYNK